MTNAKNTKRALLLSVLSMLLSVAMLAGSTFAWFQDSVTSGKNQIVAGNLDIELEYATEFNEDGTVKTWTPVTSATELFSALEKDGVTDNLWEPGHTEYVCLRVSNAGTLALKYKFDINVFGDANGETKEKTYTNIDGNEFKLSESLVFIQKDGAAKVDDRESLWISDADKEKDAMGDLTGLGLASEKMLPDEEKVVTLAVYMPTQVGNEANYKTGTDRPEIYLGLNLVATQTPHESDSFDADYDLNAMYPLTDNNGTSYKVSQEANGTLTFSPNDEPTGTVKFTADPATKELTLTDGKKYSGDVILPSAVTDGEGNVYTLTTIADRAFQSNASVKSIEIPDSVTTIGNSAFRDVSSLESVVIPSSVTKIDGGAFYGTSLKSVVIPSSVTEIKSATFGKCKELVDVTIPNSVTKIEKAFTKCTSLESITISDNVQELDAGAFNECSALKSLVIPSTTQMTGSLSFQNCAALEVLVLPSSENRHSRINMYPSQAEYMGCGENLKIYFYDESFPLDTYGNFDVAFAWTNIHGYSKPYLNAEKYLYSETEPAADAPRSVNMISGYKDNNGTPFNNEPISYGYWHMVDGVPTVWK